MAHWKLTLMYDGSAFHGWQVQPGLPTVQAVLAGALHKITGEDVLPQGSGRTDAGVHALAQVCSFTLEAPLPAQHLKRALNRMLPAAIRVTAAVEVPGSFHARHSARSKTYEYRIFEQHPGSEAHSGGTAQPEPRLCSPFLAPYTWEVRWSLDLQLLQQAAALFLGTHDFTSFAAVDPEKGRRDAASDREQGPEPDEAGVPPSKTGCVRRIDHSCWERRDGLLIYRVRGNGFLHHMVRNLTGTLVEIGRGRLPPERIASILAARDRRAAGPTAPARGLFLVAVEYGETGP